MLIIIQPSILLPWTLEPNLFAHRFPTIISIFITTVVLLMISQGCRHSGSRLQSWMFSIWKWHFNTKQSSVSIVIYLFQTGPSHLLWAKSVHHFQHFAPKNEHSIQVPPTNDDHPTHPNGLLTPTLPDVNNAYLNHKVDPVFSIMYLLCSCQ